MGCDIHMVLQKQDEENNWITVLTDVFPARDYEFFGWLAGVRGYNEYNPVGNKGLPLNYDHVVEKNTTGPWNCACVYDMATEYYLGEHSFGYISLKDFLEAKVRSGHRRMVRHKMAAEMLLGSWEAEKMRFVYGFDS